MEERREMILQSSDDAFEYSIGGSPKSLIYDLRQLNTDRIREAIERNKGFKLFVKNLSMGKSQLTKPRTDDGRDISAKPDLLREVEKFHGQIKTSTQKPVADLANDRITGELD